jgi:hypothetical protein
LRVEKGKKKGVFQVALGLMRSETTRGEKKGNLGKDERGKRKG